MVDLPPIKTELTGDTSDLARAFAEASAMRDVWLRDQVRSMEAGGGEAGKKSAASLTKEFEQAIGRSKPDPSAVDKFLRGVDDLWKRSGTQGAKSFINEFDSLFGGSGDFGRVVGDFDRLGRHSGDSFKSGFWSTTLNIFRPSSWSALQLGEDGKKLGVDFSRGWIVGIGSVFDNPATIGVGAPIVAALLSEGLAGVGGLGGAALGLGGIAAGVIGQLKNPEIKAQATKTGRDMYQALTDSSASFTRPLQVALSAYDTFVNTSTSKFAQAYDPLAKLLIPLENGFESFTDAVLPGLTNGANKAVPLIQMFAKELPEIGHALSDFFDKLTASEKGNREGLIAIIDLVDMLIRFLGNLIEVGSHAFAGLVSVSHTLSVSVDDTIGAFLRLEGKIPIIGAPFGWLGDQMSGARKELDKLAGSGDQYVPHAASAIAAVDNMTKSVNQQSNAIDKLMGRYDDWFGKSMTVDQANLTLHQDMTALNDSIDQNGKKWDLATAAGQNNYGALLTAIQGAKDLHDAEIKAGGSVDAANAELQTNIDKLITQAQKAGLDAGSVQNLRNQFGSLQNSLNSLNGDHITYYVNGIYTNNNQYYSGPPSNFYGGLWAGGAIPEAHAASGIVVAPRRPGTMVLMGEPGTRGEVAIPQAGISRQRAAALGAMALAPYGMAPAATGGGASALALSLRVPLYLNGRVVAEATYEDTVSLSQERKNRKGSTGLT